MNNTEIAALVLLIGIVVICVPIGIVSVLALKRDWNKTYFVKRERILVVGILIACGIMQYLCIPISFLLIVFKNPFLNSLYINVILPLYLINMVVGICLYSIRTWLLYFNLELTKYNLDKQWLVAMDPVTSSTNWFKNKQQTLGSARYLLSYTAILIIVTFISHILLRLVFGLPWADRGAICGIYLLFLFVDMWLWRRIRLLNEESLSIEKELLAGFWSSVGFIVAIFLANVSLYYGYVSEDIFLEMIYGPGSVYYMIVFIITTILPQKWNKVSPSTVTAPPGFGFGNSIDINLNNNNNNTNSTKKRISNLFLLNLPKSRDHHSLNTYGSGGGSGGDTPTAVGSKSPTAALSVPNKISTSTSGVPQLRNIWQSVVCTVYGFDHFMHHLQTEFSLENLLFISEYMQVKNCLRDHLKNIMCDIESTNIDARYNLQLPKVIDMEKTGHSAATREGIPMSSIAKALDTLLDNYLKDSTTRASVLKHNGQVVSGRQSKAGVHETTTGDEMKDHFERKDKRSMDLKKSPLHAAITRFSAVKRAGAGGGHGHSHGNDGTHGNINNTVFGQSYYFFSWME